MNGANLSDPERDAVKLPEVPIHNGTTEKIEENARSGQIELLQVNRATLSPAFARRTNQTRHVVGTDHSAPPVRDLRHSVPQISGSDR